MEKTIKLPFPPRITLVEVKYYFQNFLNTKPMKINDYKALDLIVENGAHNGSLYSISDTG